MFGLTILGNNSAIPAHDRHPTAQALTFNDQVFLIDCGEGTQMQLARYKVRRSKIDHIFISHLHGDHYFGLIGLVTSMGLMGRTQPLNIYGPKELEGILQVHLQVASTSLPYEIRFHAHPNEKAVLLSTEKVEVTCFPTQHRIPCHGFVFREKRQPRKIDKDAVISHQVPSSFYAQLQQGEDYVAKDGTVVKNEMVTHPNTPGRMYAFSADTIFDPSLCEHFAHADLLYHECTYLANDEQKAAERFHSTTHQAATIAVQAGVKRLLIGHFSSKYDDLQPLLEEARSIFAHTELALEGVSYMVRHQ